MKRLLVLVPVLAMALFVGCATTEDYFPMSVGSTWDYSYISTLETTTAALDTTSTMTVHTLANREATLTAGGTAVEFISTVTTHMMSPYDTTITTTDTSYTREDDSLRLHYSSFDDSVPDTSYVTTFELDKTWEEGDASFKVVAKEDVTVEGGTFKNCWKVEVTPDASPTMKSHYWYANGTGMVKYHTSYSPQTGYTCTTEGELTDANIK
jgi:hypothetical protein